MSEVGAAKLGLGHAVGEQARPGRVAFQRFYLPHPGMGAICHKGTQPCGSLFSTRGRGPGTLHRPSAEKRQRREAHLRQAATARKPDENIDLQNCE
jgi:hypothetical protein